MNRSMIDKQWEAARDGLLDESQRQQFERWLDEHPPLRELWEEEGRWLAMIQHHPDTAEDSLGTPEPAFTQSVLDRWQAGRKRGRHAISRLQLQVAATAMAVAAMVLISAVPVFFHPADVSTPVAEQFPDEPHPVGILLTGFQEGMHRATDQPSLLLARLSDPAPVWDRLHALLDQPRDPQPD